MRNEKRPNVPPLAARSRCRECGAPLSASEALRTRARLAGAFPGIDARHAYCASCADLVEDLLFAVRPPGSAVTSE